MSTVTSRIMMEPGKHVRRNAVRIAEFEKNGAAGILPLRFSPPVL
ncbi:MAG: hypothetical protein OZ929_13500 [Bryobacterales bacterium]|nr:hypothetical protein [Bryobacterales bacterium]